MSEARPGWKASLLLLQRAFVPLALAFLAWAAYQSRDTVAQVLGQAQPRILACVVLLWAALQLFPPMATWFALRGLGSPLPYRDVLRIHVHRLPARYLPGGIWHTVSRVVDLDARGVRRAELPVLIALENLAPLSVALVVGGLLALASGNVVLPSQSIVALGLAIGASLPWLLRAILRQARPVSLAAYGGMLAALAAFWAVAGSAFCLYLAAFRDLQLASDPVSVFAAYLLSWAAGFVAVFAPQGIGVFEVVAGYLLDGELPLAGMAVLVAGFRAVSLAGDALAYGIGELLAGSGRRPAKTAD